MPTDNYQRTAGLLPLATLPILGAQYPRPNTHIISHFSMHCLTGNTFQANSFGSGTSIGANVATMTPFVIAHPFLVRKVFWANGSTATTDNIDVGVYSDQFKLIVSGGGTLASGSNATQEVDVTDTLLQPGVYYLAFVQNGTTMTPILSNLSIAGYRGLGCARMTSAYPLPSTFTPSAITVTRLPLCGIASRTLAS